MTMIPFNTQVEPFEIDYEDEGTHAGGWDEWTVQDEGHIDIKMTRRVYDRARRIVQPLR